MVVYPASRPGKDPADLFCDKSKFRETAMILRSGNKISKSGNKQQS